MNGLNYLHKNKIAHRDLKPENILLTSTDDDNFNIKISDLGFAQQQEEDKSMTLVLGSPLYMAPELVRAQAYTEKVDVWSLGVVAYQLLSGRTPFESRSLQKIDWNIKHKPISFNNRSEWGDISDDAKKFIMACLERDQTKRPSISDLFQQPWIKQYKQGLISTINPFNTQQMIWENFVRFCELNPLQKLVLSLVAGLSASPQELEEMGAEFQRLDKNRTGSLTIEDVKKICETEIGRQYQVFSNTDWLEIIKGVDLNGDGVIDFQDFISATVDRKTLYKEVECLKAFKIIDKNDEGYLSLSDF